MKDEHDKPPPRPLPLRALMPFAAIAAVSGVDMSVLTVTTRRREPAPETYRVSPSSTRRQAVDAKRAAKMARRDERARKAGRLTP